MAERKLFNIPIDTRTPDELIPVIIDHATQKKSPLRILQINPEMIADMYRRPKARELCVDADIIVPNGVGLQWAATYADGHRSLMRLLVTLSWVLIRPTKVRQIIPARYTSSSFTAPLLKQLSLSNAHVLIAGAPKGSDISSTASHLRGIAPGLQVTSFDTSGFTRSGISRLIDAIKQHKPDVILLAIGYPMQEEAAHKIQKVISHGVIITEGGTFDYDQFGGRIRRAPVMLRKIGLEWLWRLFREPWRLVRQFALVRFIMLTYKKA